MIIRALPPWLKVSTVTIGVPKSCTSSRRSRLRGSVVLMKSTISTLPCCRMSMPVELSERSTTIRPSPLAPRRKSTSRSVCWTSPGRDSAKRCTICALASSWSPWSNSVTSTALPSTVRLERLRPVEVEHDARAVAGLDHVDAAQRDVVDGALRRAEAVAGVEEVERDPRRSRDRESGRADWPAASSA